MQIASFQVRTVETPMRMAVQHALAQRKTARNVVVAASGADGTVGWGECCPRPYVSGETVESARDDLAQTILPRLVGGDVSDLTATADWLLAILDGLRRNQHAAFCAAELAVLDLAGRVVGCSAGEVLGPVVTGPVAYTAVIAASEPNSVEAFAQRIAEMGFAEVKVKVVAELETNQAILRAARDVLGEDVALRADANCAWDAAEAIRQLDALQTFRLEGIEQPVPAEDFAGMAQVTAAKITPVVADESLCSLADAERLIETGGCDIFNVRISKCGGLANAGRIAARAAAAGLRSQLGAQVGEMGTLTAAGRHFGTRTADVLWFEGSYGQLLLEEDPFEPDLTIGLAGRAPALTAPGLGVDPIGERLDALTTESFDFP